MYLEGKVAASVKKTEFTVSGNPLRWPRDTLYLQELALFLPRNGSGSVGILRSRTKAADCFFPTAGRCVS
jgi:hypothetical protein